MVNIMRATVRTVWREPAAVCVYCLGDLLRESDGTWRAAGTEGDDARRCPSPDAFGHVHAGHRAVVAARRWSPIRRHRQIAGSPGTRCLAAHRCLR